MMQSKTKAAGTIFESLVQRDSTRPEFWAYWAEALIQQGSAGSAEAKLRKALALSPGMAQAYVDLGDIRLKSADSKRGTNLTATSTASLRAARALYEEAKGYYGRALSDQSYSEYARLRIEYADKTIGLVDKELFVRD
jgi:tetratricopeptide (TPR) repeat protein